MKGIDLKPVLHNIQKTVQENSSQILLWIGVTCSVSAIVTSVPATVKAVRAVDFKKHEKKVEKLPFWDTIKATWQYYIPTIVLGTMSVICVVESSSIASKRTAAIAAAYQISESAFKEYQNQVIEKVGDKKEQEIQENTVKKQVENSPLSQNPVIVTSHGKTLCFDTLSGRYFTSDVDKINRAVNELNRQMTCSIEGSVTLNEFYEALMLEPIGIGDNLGWNVPKGIIDMRYSSHLAEDNTPCLVLDYKIRPYPIY